MRLTPSEILQRLGFDIPDEGIAFNPRDSSFIDTSLQLLGKTIDVTAIPDADLENLYVSLGEIVAIQRNREPYPLRDDSVGKVRGLIQSFMNITLKRRHLN